MTPAPCAGFVWFRWVRPRTWHDYRPCHVVFDSPLHGVVIETVHLKRYLHETKLTQYAHWRPTVQHCRRCMKARWE